MTGTSKHNHEEKVEEGSVKELKNAINNLCNFFTSRAAADSYVSVAWGSWQEDVC